MSRAAQELRVRLPVAVDLDTPWRPVPACRWVPSARRYGRRSRRPPLTAALAADGSLRLVGLMAYEGQVAGVGDRVPGRPLRSLAVRGCSASLRELATGCPGPWTPSMPSWPDGERLDLVNGGGTGSLPGAPAGAVTDLPAGSGLYAPPSRHVPLAGAPAGRPVRPPVVRRPGPGVATCSVAVVIRTAGAEGCPPRAPGRPRLTGQEGPGEVQSPFRGAAADLRRSATWCGSGTPRPVSCASGSTLCGEGGRLVDEVPTYRGEGHTFL